MSYGETEAVRGIDLEVTTGEIFAFLGPNGAGKTSTVEILEGYRKRTGGAVSVLGEDPEHAGRAWRDRIGIVLQSNSLDPYLTVRESIELYAGYFSHPRAVEETIALVGLEEKADERARKLSGGQQRRLDVGMALVGDPELLFLDEPTTGFDPSARRQFWDVIAGLRDLGKTIFLTTHYMDEAERLADRVTIIAGGGIAGLASTRRKRSSMSSFACRCRSSSTICSNARWLRWCTRKRSRFATTSSISRSSRPGHAATAACSSGEAKAR